jgi:hypothetical protein
VEERVINVTTIEAIARRLKNEINARNMSANIARNNGNIAINIERNV